MAKYFTKDEFACQYTGNNEIQDKFIDKLDELREACGFPFVLTSGYRDKTNPVEDNKAKPRHGTPATGLAADIQVPND